MKEIGSFYSKPALGLWFLTKNYRFLFLTAIASQAIAVSSGTFGHLLIKYFTDEIILKSRWDIPLVYFALGYLVLAIIRGLFSFLAGKGSAATAEGIAKQIRNYLFDHIQKLSFSYHDKAHTGELVQRATSDVDATRRFYNDQVTQITRISFLFVINYTTIIILNWQLALCSIIVIPFIVLVSVYFFKRIFSAYNSYQDQDGTVSAVLQENLSGIRVVKAFARQEFEKQKFETENIEKFKRGKKLFMSHALYWPVSHILCTIQMVGGIAIGCFFVLNDYISLGTFIAYSGLLNSIIWPLQHLGRVIAQLSTSYVSFRRVTEIIKHDQEKLTTSTQKKYKKINGKICFNNVGFAYEKDTAILENISFCCMPGQVLALIGETGSGKTSVVNLIPRFYEKTSGNITIDDIPIQQIDRHDLRKNIGIVEQEPFLFSTTIRENITYGVERDVNQEEIETAAQKAVIHQDILAFPDGYNTLVGEKGVTLSGGQKQRVAIARTILKDPKILILDASTSAVDAETERKILKALEQLMQGRTTIIIAHRLQSLVKADNILVFKQGKIIQRGKHKELIKKPGFYKRVYQLQTQIENELELEIKQQEKKEW